MNRDGPGKVISERLGHASVAFTLQTYGHVIPGMDKDAATTVADLILGVQKGLRLRERYADWDRRPFGSDSASHISVYRPA